MSNRRNFLFALEEDQVGLDEEVGSPAEANLELVEAEAEMTEEATAVDEHADTLDSSVDDIGELTTVNEVLEKTVETGDGATEETAEIAEVAIEAICARLGIRNKVSVIPALESFGSKNTRLAATRIAVENTKEKIASAWKAVLAFFARMWERIKGFFKKIWAGIVSFKNKLVSIKNNWKKARAANKELKAKYTVKGKLDKVAYKAAVEAGKAAAKEASQKTKEAAKVIADLQKAADAGDAAAVDSLITGFDMGQTPDFSGVADKVLEAAKEGAKEETEVSGTEAVSTVDAVIDAAENAANDLPSQAEVDKSLGEVETSVKKLAEHATQQGAKLATESSDQTSNEDVTDVKAKLQIWTKIKTFASKLFGYISTFVTGVYRRVYALISFGIRYVIAVAGSLGLIIGGAAVTGSVGAYQAVVHGKDILKN